MIFNATSGISWNTAKKLIAANLLDNSDFTNPVAQAGVGGNHGAVAYAVDRWILDSGTVSFETGVGLTLNGTIRQKLEHPPAGAVSAFVGLASGEASISYADGEVTVTSSGGTLQWAALYEGTYTAGTQPSYVPKGYGAELLECQRYYHHNLFIRSVAFNAWEVYAPSAVLNPPMAALPTFVFHAYISKATGMCEMYKDGSWQDVPCNASDWGTTYVSVNCGNGGLTPGCPVRFLLDACADL